MTYSCFGGAVDINATEFDLLNLSFPNIDVAFDSDPPGSFAGTFTDPAVIEYVHTTPGPPCQVDLYSRMELIGVDLLDVYYRIEFTGSCTDCEDRFWHRTAGPPSNTCGDGVLNCGVEECDDGNLGSGDGCDGSCLIEAPTTTWTWNGTSTDWNDCDNWTPQGLPRVGDSVTIDGSQNVDVPDGILLDTLQVASSYSATVSLLGDASMSAFDHRGGTVDGGTGTITVADSFEVYPAATFNSTTGELVLSGFADLEGTFNPSGGQVSVVADQVGNLNFRGQTLHTLQLVGLSAAVTVDTMAVGGLTGNLILDGTGGGGTFNNSVGNPFTVDGDLLAVGAGAITTGGTFHPTVDGNVTLVGATSMQGTLTLATSSGTFDRGGATLQNLTVTGSPTVLADVTLAGDLLGLGTATFDMNGFNLTANDMQFVGTSFFTPGSGTVTAESLILSAASTMTAGTGLHSIAQVAADGTATWTATSGITSIRDSVTIQSSATFDPNGGEVQVGDIFATATIRADGATFNDLTLAQEGATYLFGANETVTIAGNFNALGSVANDITLGRDGGSGSDQWSIDPQGGRNVDYVDVSNSNNTSGVNIDPANWVDSGNNDGWGPGVSPAVLEISESDPYNFGPVAVGAIGVYVFTVTNTGGSTATSLSGSGLSGSFSFAGGSFPGTGGDCPDGGPLGALGTCNIGVEFSPGSTGAHADTIEIDYFDGVAPQTATRDVSGTGAFPALLTISESDPYDFGMLEVGSSSTHSFTVQNFGGVAAVFSDTDFSLGTTHFDWVGGSFPGTGGNCLGSVPGSGNCTIFVEFAPSAGGDHTNTIELDYDDGVATQQVTRDIAGEGWLCGDAQVDGPEECDTGATDNNGSCSTVCTASFCGDGFVECGVEECDGGPNCLPGVCTRIGPESFTWDSERVDPTGAIAATGAPTESRATFDNGDVRRHESVADAT